MPVWNAVEVTRRCLSALRSTLGPEDQVIVVDDGSTDETSQMLASQSSWIDIVTHPVNLGFAAACNDGALRARHDIVIFLNNDTVPESSWICDLLQPFSDEKIGAAGPMSNNISGDQQVCDAAEPIRRARAEAIVRSYRNASGPQWHETNRLVGFCFAVRTMAFHELGGFDLRYGKGGYEDDDLCLRLMLSDWRLVIVETAFMHHSYHATFDANGVDWFSIQQHNRQLYEHKLASACSVSILVRCGRDQGALLHSLLSVQESLAGHRYEVALLVPDRAAITELLAGLGSTVRVVDIDSNDEGWQSGQHAATGLRRIWLRAGDVLSEVEVRLVLQAPIGTQLLPQ